MFRRWFSEFWKKNKKKIGTMSKVFLILIFIGLALSTMVDNKKEIKEETESKIYNPSKTIISGENIDEEIFEQEENLIKEFVDYCNSNKIEEAYDLLTDECKEKIYPNLDDFKNKYFNRIFSKNKEFNLQSWIVTKDSNTYKVSFIEDIMSTGSYENAEKFEDYITIVKKDDKEKININGYIKSEALNITTKTNEMEIKANNVDIYMDNVIYNLSIKNLTDNDILLDSLKYIGNIKLVGTNNAEYSIDDTNMFYSDLVILGEENNKIELKFKKQYGSDVNGKNIKFEKVITDYKDFLKNIDSYDKYIEVNINLM